MSGEQENSDYFPSVSPANVGAKELSTNAPELMAVSPGDDSPHQPPEESVLDLQRKHSWLITRKEQFEAQVLANDPDRNSDIDNMTEDELKSLQKSLTEKLQEKTVIKDTQELLLEGERLRRLNLSVLFDDRDAREKKRLNICLEYYSKSISGAYGWFSRSGPHLLISKRHVTLSNDRNTGKELCEMRNDLDVLRKHNFELKRKSRMIYEEIDKKKKEKEEEIKALATDEMGNSIQEQLESRLHENKYRRHILQGVILGSGIQWAKDDKILNMMINAGQNPPI